MSHSQGNKIRFRVGGEHISVLTSREKTNQCWGVAVESAGHSFHLAAVFDLTTPLRGVNHCSSEKSFFCSPFAAMRGCILRSVLWVNQRSRLASSLFWLLREENYPMSCYDPSFDSVCVWIFFSLQDDVSFCVRASCVRVGVWLFVVFLLLFFW